LLNVARVEAADDIEGADLIKPILVETDWNCRVFETEGNCSSAVVFCLCTGTVT